MSKASEERGACSVTEALNIARRDLEKIRLTVIGEVSELSSKRGYKAVYFTIRDDACALPCLIWNDKYRACGIELAVGMLVEITGRFSCYPAKGRMQFSVDSIVPAGEGTLRLQVAQIARKLEAEGLMDPGRKRKLKALPQRIGVVTSPRGKAIHDVIQTLRKRYPLAELLVYGVKVEGVGAVEELLSGLRCACETQPAPDVILLVRGGGTYEELMPFNDERLARAVAACPIPVVTGIGHGPDNSLCDLVADVRQPTPTGAAEAVAPSIEELAGKLGNATRALNSAYASYIDAQRAALARLSDRQVWRDAHYLTGMAAQQLDYLAARLQRAIPDAVSSDVRQVEDYAQRLSRAVPLLLAGYASRLEAAHGQLARAGAATARDKAQKLEALRRQLASAGGSVLRAHTSSVALAAAKLDALSPLKTLSRGYSISYGADGHTVIDSVAGVAAGDDISVQVQDGMLACTVNAVERQGQ